MDSRLTPSLANWFATIALGHVGKEFPHKLDHILMEEGERCRPHDLHPIFFGSYDWHSCVHSYWLLARLSRLFPEMQRVGDIQALFKKMFTPENVDAETTYLMHPTNAGFERPYGWAWALMLAAEFLRAGSDALKPLELAVAARFQAYLPKLTYPIRTGTHFNTAFSLILAEEYARIAGNAELRNLMADRASDWFGRDRDAPAWEPSGDDFLSGTLVEAECMRVLLPPKEFGAWFDAFMPRLSQMEPASLFAPAIVSNRGDGKMAHLDGLNLSRAWCMKRLASAFVEQSRKDVLLDAAERHILSALAHVADDYAGEHWLATYALMALAPEN
jgi:hypothetical protein